jgi:hypothetical protein
MPARPEYQPVIDAVVAFMREHSMNMTQLCDLMYGRSPAGKVKGSGQVYSIANGQHLPNARTIERWRAKGVDLQPAVDQVNASRQGMRTAAVAAYEKAVPKSSPARPVPYESRRVDPPLFALSIDQSGRANVTLNMMDISSDEALRCMGVLTAANLITVRK